MPRDERRLTFGVIGCGHWGPNHVRVFSELTRSHVIACADSNTERLAKIRARFPTVDTTEDFEQILDDNRIDAVVIATPPSTHTEITRQALLAGKHVLVEKPLCLTGQEAAELGALAEKAHLVLMVGHVFLFNNAIIRLRESIHANELGRIHYLDAARTNLGPVRGDVNSLFDLGTHDISIFNYLLDEVPVEVSALGRCIAQESIEDVCFATLKYPDGTLGHIHVSWMNPRKVRTVTVIGERKMAHWDDVDPSDTLRIYDKGLKEPPYYDSFGGFHCVLRNADMYVPAIHSREPLQNQAEAFLDWVLEGRSAPSGVREAWNIARVLDAATRSMRQAGVMCRVDTVPAETVTQASMNSEQVSITQGRPHTSDAMAPAIQGVPDHPVR